MKFSIIIPTYNEEQYVENCLKSLVSQDYNKSEFEIIVSDSSSGDRTVEIARPIADKVVITKTRGIAHGRNFGAKSSTGEILLFVDADVELDRGFLKNLETEFQNDVVAVTGLALPADGNMFQRLAYRGTYVLVRAFDALGMPLYPGLCVAYGREAFEQVGGFREDFGVVEDLDLSKRISKLGRCRASKNAIARVSTRRLKKHGFSTVLFHIYNDVRYLLTGKSSRFYPKSEELDSASDLWRMNRQ